MRGERAERARGAEQSEEEEEVEEEERVREGRSRARRERVGEEARVESDRILPAAKLRETIQKTLPSPPRPPAGHVF
jgi:hypothetical protein